MTDKMINDNEDFGFENWFRSIIEEAFIPGWATGPLPCDDQGVAYL